MLSTSLSNSASIHIGNMLASEISQQKHTDFNAPAYDSSEDENKTGGYQKRSSSTSSLTSLASLASPPHFQNDLIRRCNEGTSTTHVRLSENISPIPMTETARLKDSSLKKNIGSMFRIDAILDMAPKRSAVKACSRSTSSVISPKPADAIDSCRNMTTNQWLFLASDKNSRQNVHQRRISASSNKDTISPIPNSPIIDIVSDDNFKEKKTHRKELSQPIYPGIPKPHFSAFNIQGNTSLGKDQNEESRVSISANEKLHRYPFQQATLCPPYHAIPFNQYTLAAAAFAASNIDRNSTDTENNHSPAHEKKTEIDGLDYPKQIQNFNENCNPNNNINMAYYQNPFSAFLPVGHASSLFGRYGFPQATAASTMPGYTVNPSLGIGVPGASNPQQAMAMEMFRNGSRIFRDITELAGTKLFNYLKKL